MTQDDTARSSDLPRPQPPGAADGRRLLEEFEACTLEEEFAHADHVQVAWLILREEALEDALGRFTRALRRFAAHRGAHGLYHQTITWAYFFVINERMARMPEDHDWAAFSRENPDLFENHKLFLSRYYRAETLSSDLARQAFLLPDGAALAVAA